MALARSTQWVHPSQRFQMVSIHPTSICRVLRKTLSCLSLGGWEQDFYCGSSELLVNVKDTPQIKILRVHLHDYCNRIITQYKPVVMEYTPEIYGLGYQPHYCNQVSNPAVLECSWCPRGSRCSFHETTTATKGCFAGQLQWGVCHRHLDGPTTSWWWSIRHLGSSG